MRRALLVVVVLGCRGTPEPAPGATGGTQEPAPAARASIDAAAPDHRSSELACEDAIGDPAMYPVPLADDAPERDWVLRVRRGVLVHECGHGWPNALKACLANAPTPAAIARCIDDELGGEERDHITEALAELEKLAQRMTTMRRSPASLDCKRVVALHYGDARWKGKLASYSAAERIMLIADSRARMHEACTDGAWSTTLRACIVAGGGNTCFESFGMALSWGYPAAGVVRTIGISECDGYGKVIERIVACEALPATTRDTLRAMYAKTKAAMAGATAADRAKLATSCKAGRDTIEQLAISSGC